MRARATSLAERSRALDGQIFSHKICCDLLEARLVASKFFKIVLGGTAALHAYRVWGAVIF
jgi:hypothetical protein